MSQQQPDLFRSIEQPKGGAFFCAERFSVRTDRSSSGRNSRCWPGAASGAGACRRSEPARRGAGAAIRAARRARRPDHARQYDLADDACRRRHREGQCRAAGELLLARHGRGPGFEPSDLRRFLNIQACSTIPSWNPAEGDRRHPQGCRRCRICFEISGAPAADRAGADGRRGIRHDQGECRPQRQRDHCDRAVHTVDGVALVRGSFSRSLSASSSGSRSRRRSAC